ncbi:hypothetical protein laban61_gp053 [Flavobacterium phage vB_FspS_laban6-1]|uniref:Uncharacterized protein n=2 Tax=root TaxID=1 RepID=A0A6B9LMA0_9CAUD|nr:hypothetical protein HWC90_gp53 [Flavobacterium phage vB_FspS_laban6-1]QHB39024.1 hypothetical protein laban61_gp053 [Flavobacterium phage vB_FspS_laban6-1]
MCLHSDFQTLPFRREFLKLIIMTKEIIKSKINAVEARIQQIKESDLFTPAQKEKLVSVNEKELNQLETQLALQIEVINPESL